MDKKELREYGKIDTMVILQAIAVDENGEVDPEAVEAVTMIGRLGIETVLLSPFKEAEADEVARRLGATRVLYETEDYMAVIESLENEGREVLYTENLDKAEEYLLSGRKEVSKTRMMRWAAIGMAAALALILFCWIFL